MHYGSDGSQSHEPGMSDGMKLGLLGGVLGLTGLVAFAYRDGGWLAKKSAKGFPGVGHTNPFPIGSEAWQDWQNQKVASGMPSAGHTNPYPIGSELWQDWQTQKQASGMPTAGSTNPYPVGSELWQDWQTQKQASGPSSYTATAARETPQSIADKFGVTNNPGWAGALSAANPGVSWPIMSGQTINIPSDWPYPAY